MSRLRQTGMEKLALKEWCPSPRCNAGPGRWCEERRRGLWLTGNVFYASKLHIARFKRAGISFKVTPVFTRSPDAPSDP